MRHFARCELTPKQFKEFALAAAKEGLRIGPWLRKLGDNAIAENIKPPH